MSTFREKFNILARAVVANDAKHVKEICSSDWYTENRPDIRYRTCCNSDFDSVGTSLIDVTRAWNKLLNSEWINKTAMPVSIVEFDNLRIKAEATRQIMEKIFHTTILPKQVEYNETEIDANYSGFRYYRKNYRKKSPYMHIDNLLSQAFFSDDRQFFETLIRAGANPWSKIPSSNRNTWQEIQTSMNHHLKYVLENLSKCMGNMNVADVIAHLIKAEQDLIFYETLIRYYPDPDQKDSIIATHPRIVYFQRDAWFFEQGAIDITFNRIENKLYVVKTPAGSKDVEEKDLKWLFDDSTFRSLQHIVIKDTGFIILDGFYYNLVVINDEGRVSFTKCDDAEIGQVPEMCKLKALCSAEGGEKLGL